MDRKSWRLWNKIGARVAAITLLFVGTAPVPAHASAANVEYLYGQGGYVRVEAKNKNLKMTVVLVDGRKLEMVTSATRRSGGLEIASTIGDRLEVSHLLSPTESGRVSVTETVVRFRDKKARSGGPEFGADGLKPPQAAVLLQDALVEENGRDFMQKAGTLLASLDPGTSSSRSSFAGACAANASRANATLGDYTGSIARQFPSSLVGVGAASGWEVAGCIAGVVGYGAAVASIAVLGAATAGAGWLAFIGVQAAAVGIMASCSQI